MFPPCLIEPVPSGFKMSLPPAKAKFINDRGSTFGKTNLKKKLLQNSNISQKRVIRTSENN